MKTIEGWGIHEVKSQAQNQNLIACSAVLGFVAYLGTLVKVFIF